MVRKFRTLFLGLVLIFGLPDACFARQRSRGHHGSGSHHAASRGSSSAHSKHGRIKRSAKAKDDFMRQTGYPHGRKGYVVDHKVALACGGTDSPSNMQWQTKAEAKAKD